MLVLVLGSVHLPDHQSLLSQYKWLAERQLQVNLQLGISQCPTCLWRGDYGGLPPAPHPHFRIVEFREPASALTSNRSGYVRTMQIRTVHFRAIISARKSSSAVHFRTRGTLHVHSRSARGKRSAHFISATSTRTWSMKVYAWFSSATGMNGTATTSLLSLHCCTRPRNCILRYMARVKWKKTPMKNCSRGTNLIWQPLVQLRSRLLL